MTLTRPERRRSRPSPVTVPLAGVKVLRAKHPEWNGDVDAFEKVYLPVVRFRYSLRQQNPRPVFVPDELLASRTCALCEKKEPEVTFQELSHIMPASLGNRRWFSREECDACNHLYEPHDRALADMLTSARILGRVRARTGTAKIKAPRGRSSIGGGTFDGPLLVRIHAEDTSIKFERFDEKKTVRLTFPQPAFSPFLAIRSLVRACWLGLSTEDRASLRVLHDFVTATRIPAVNEYFDMRLTGAMYNYVMLEGWSRASGCGLDVAPFVLRLCFVDRVVMWSSPDPASNQHVPSPLPPVPVATGVETVRGELRRGPLDANFGSGTETRTLTYESGGTDLGEIAQPRPPRLEQAVSLELETAAGLSIIGRTTETIYEYDPIDELLTTRIEGGDLAGPSTFGRTRTRSRSARAWMSRVTPQTVSGTAIVSSKGC